MFKRFGIFINAKLFKNALFWFLSIALHKYISMLVYNKGTELELDSWPPLYDLIQNNMPNLQPYRVIPEILHLIPILIFLYLTVTTPNNNSVNALQKMFSVHSQLLILRCICFAVTLLPDSSQMCKVTQFVGSCYDLIFSGHTTAMFLFTYLVKEFFRINKCFYSILQINNFITSILIIACRNHYTIDVIISILATNYFYFQYNYKQALSPYNTYP